MVTPQVWQIAAGETGRLYPELFIDHDVMCMGPGDAGEFDFDKYVRRYPDRYPGRGGTDIISQMRSFREKVRPRDIVLLREYHKVSAIGVVADDGYSWRQAFDDVYGWDLQHTQRVIWQDHLTGPLQRLQRAGELFAGRKQIPTFTKVSDRSVLAPLKELLAKCRLRPLRALPNVSAPLTTEELREEFFARGLQSRSADSLLAAIDRQQRLWRWYECYGKASGRPAEHEVVAHMVLPMLVALGWSEQLLAVEWNRIDLAAFNGTPTTRENCILVCEAKGRGKGMQDVCKQAKAYVAKFELRNCRKILLTEGTRFYLYEATGGKWDDAPCGYFNINKLRKTHVAPQETNAVDTIVSLTPAGVARHPGKGA